MKYFEVYNDDGSRLLIDDSYVNLEVLGKFKLSELKRFYSLSSLVESDPERYKDYLDYGGYYCGDLISNIEATNITYGIGLDFNQNVEFTVDLCDTVSFYTSHSIVTSNELEPVFRPELEDILTVYIIGIPTRKPSMHGVGLEVYNERGETIFKSGKKHIDVVSCGSDKTESVDTKENRVIFQLGRDYYLSKFWWHHLPPAGQEYYRIMNIKASNGRATLKPKDVIVTYNEPGIVWHPDGYYENSHRPPAEEETFMFYYNYGWLIADIV